jgi:hypothetical protein
MKRDIALLTGDTLRSGNAMNKAHEEEGDDNDEDRTRQERIGI